MRVAGTNRNTFRARLIAALLLSCVVLASCGYEQGYESLEVRYEGVPINLEAAEETFAEASPNGESGEQASPNQPSSGGAVGGELAYTVDSANDADAESTDEPVNEATSPDVEAVDDEQDHLAHRVPDLPAGQPEAENPANAVDDLESEDSDLRAKRRALNSFRGLVSNATSLGSGEIECIVEYVRSSGVNPIPMNRALRRGLSGKNAQPARRYVALAYDATSSCGVTLSESLLR